MLPSSAWRKKRCRCPITANLEQLALPQVADVIAAVKEVL